MAEKKGLFLKMLGKRKNGCCDIRIEEIPEDEGREQVPAQEPRGGCCCGGVMPNVERIDVNGKRTGVIGIRETITEVKRLKLADQEQIKDELILRIRQRNYIAPGCEEAYREALWREYQK